MEKKVTSFAPYEPVIVVQGGAGEIPQSRVQPKLVGTRKAARVGYKILTADASLKGDETTHDEISTALRAVVAAVSSMEDDGAFNAGYGSALTEDGTVEMDAGVMEGTGIRSGAVAAIGNVKNPIQVAARVLTDSPHCLLAGDGANRFARQKGFPEVPGECLVSDYARAALCESATTSLMRNEFGQSSENADAETGTVGAVALDREGNLVAATSTGGLTGQLAGRVGDSPIIGAGFYAEEGVGAVSVTGFGELLLRSLASKRIATSMSERGLTPEEAVMEAMEYATAKLGGDGGGIAIGPTGEVGVAFNSRRMGWAYAKQGWVYSGCDRDQVLKEKL